MCWHLGKKGLLIIVIIAGAIVWSEVCGMIREGTPAPHIETTLSSGQPFSLADYLDKKHVVLFFYPKDFTPGCTREACSFRDHYAELTNLDAVLIGVSFDTEQSHSEFIEKYRLPFPLISDIDNSIGTAYGVARFGGLLFRPKRVTFVIDKGGIVRKVSHHEFSIDKHLDEVLASLKTLRDEGAG